VDLVVGDSDLAVVHILFLQTSGTVLSSKSIYFSDLPFPLEHGRASSASIAFGWSVMSMGNVLTTMGPTNTLAVGAPLDSEYILTSTNEAYGWSILEGRGGGGGGCVF
jgi:hypothetical protein